MSFFNSDLVKKEMEEITELQEKIYDSVFKFPTMNNKEKLEHIEILEKLLNKQQILYTRLSLSDDPQAKSMRDMLIKEAKMIGFPDDVDIRYVFSNMCTMIEAMKKTIQEST
jgi:hypothetical protein|tara:strand:+ start:229 stop:564 length:336 start_codon:yes stop_codon:yes gene_type:complete